MKEIKKATWELDKPFNSATVAKAVAMIVWGIEDYKNAPELMAHEQFFECHPVVRETGKVIIFKTAVSNRIIQISKKRPIVRFIAPRGSVCLFHQLNSVLGAVFGRTIKKVEANTEVDTEKLLKNIFSWSDGPYMTNYTTQQKAVQIFKKEAQK